jgi:uncharacterized protein (DUF983 family)
MNWPKKGTKLYSILKYKCPHCHEGEFFKSRNPYDFSNLSATHDHCPNCGRKLYIEPGFYYGAMYVSYALGVAHVVTFWVAKTVLGIEFEFWNFIFLVAGILILLSPLYYALSKIIWANLFLNYKGDEDGESTSK